jgi:hypothetical protein
VRKITTSTREKKKKKRAAGVTFLTDDFGSKSNCTGRAFDERASAVTRG